MIVFEHNNGDITVQLETCERSSDEGQIFFTLTEELFWLDTYPVGEGYCLGNYAMGQTLYNCRLDTCYVFSTLDFTPLVNGEEVRLYAHNPSEAEREEIESWI